MVVDDAASLARKGSRKRARSSGNVLGQITTLVIGQVMGGLHANGIDGTFPKGVLVSAVERLMSQWGVQVNISNGKNSPAHVAGSAFFGNLQRSLAGPRSFSLFFHTGVFFTAPVRSGGGLAQ